MDKKIIITGANGFVGSWLSESLCSENAIYGLVRKESKLHYLKLKNLENKIEIRKGDITDPRSLEKVFSEAEFDFCFNLAAKKDIRTLQDVKKAFDVNVNGTLNVLKACKKHNVGAVIHASTTNVYGKHNKKVLTEDLSLNASGPYAATKARSDELARLFSQKNDLPLVVVRISKIFGPNDLMFSQLVTKTIENVIKDKRPIIYGKGESKIDLIFIKDVIDFYSLLLREFNKNFRGDAFNIATGNKISILDFVKKVIKLSDKKIKPRFIDNEKEESSLPISIKKTMKTFGWKPKYPLEKSLKQTIEWYKEYLNYKI
jgi:nucleoside-diphosphate-sugar epimerase